MQKKKFEELVRGTEINNIQNLNDKSLLFDCFNLVIGGNSIENIFKDHERRINMFFEKIKELNLKLQNQKPPDVIYFDDLKAINLQYEINKLKFIIKQNLKLDPDEYDLVTEDKTETKLVKKEKYNE